MARRNQSRQTNETPPPNDGELPQSFEQCFTELEQVARTLEAGRLSLEEATRTFERGMKLARRCNELLSAAELKVTRLQSAFAEQMRFVSESIEDIDDDNE